MKNQYILTKEQNIFLAKKTMVNEIFNLAIIENCNVTLIDTQTILDGYAPKIPVDDIITVKNLESAWKFMVQNIEDKLDLDFICKLNLRVSNNESLDPGSLRSGRVSISGTDFIPPIPQRIDVEEKLNKIMTTDKSETEKSFDLCLFLMKNQLFWDGNKRTAIIATNKYLIQNGCGLLSIQSEDNKEFNTKLSHYYSTDEDKPIKEFFYSKCIKGLVFEK